MFRDRKRASLTVEAALALPLFMSGLLTLVSVLYMWRTAMRIQASLLNKAGELAIECSDGRSISISDVGEDIADGLLPEDLRLIKDGRDGIDILSSDISDREYISLCLKCRLIPLTDRFGLLSVPFERKCITHIWCGYDHGFFPDGEYVYITEESEVYHMNRDCSHLRLTVREVTADKMGDLRNESGSRYRPCGHCHAKLSDNTLYITPDGDRYHNSITCSGLKRTVRAIRIEEVGNRRPCSRCGSP